jgi:hypothetical protein
LANRAYGEEAIAVYMLAICRLQRSRQHGLWCCEIRVPGQGTADPLRLADWHWNGGKRLLARRAALS